MRINFIQAIVAGIIGTIAFDISAVVLAGQLWPEPRLLAEKLELPFAAGLVGHYGIGMLLAIIFAAIAPSLWGPTWLRGLTFFTLETVFGIWLFMLPLLGLGPLGLKMGIMFPLVILARHWVLGVVVALAYDRLGSIMAMRSMEGARA